MTHTQLFTVNQGELANYRAMAQALLFGLNWRHAGFGALQGYITEGDKTELRLHIWHPALIREGIQESGLCHDHRFDMRSVVLAGRIDQVEFSTFETPDGDYHTNEVLHARAAKNEGGNFHKDPMPDGKRYRREAHTFPITKGMGYYFPKYVFHETRALGTTITLVRKLEQDSINARILTPVGKPIVHAFAEPCSDAVVRMVLQAADDILS